MIALYSINLFIKKNIIFICYLIEIQEIKIKITNDKRAIQIKLIKIR